ncbi:zinc finger MYM-type protein 1-like [Olea europaea var. sylvestris]|uniref:zinc finger MYM-type protein 1-like n=1 Tax=Olea europaea var. sylvestris TaxID=158386 RepID=UPI000C1D469E|nr:zinc finger MYM-type protein 1-like [Olea europaea var. sylvestris]
MAIISRFVDKSRQVKEHFLGMSYITNTCVQSLKDDIDAMFSTRGLSISSLRGQGYDGASNMLGEFNGLKALILRENPHAMYVNCFAHQFQLAIVSVTHRNCMLGDLFNVLAIIVNLVCASCKRVDAFRTSYQANILEKLNIGELTSGRGQFQEMSLECPGDTRWGSYLLTITRFINMVNAIIDVLENILEDGVHLDQKSSAVRQMNAMQEFEFNLRENGWDTLLSRVIEFCVDRHILVPNMEDIVVVKGRPRHVAQQVTYFHRFYVDLYCHAIDSILQELNDHFLETTTELFTCISCLSPRDSFAAFDKNKLLHLAQFYPLDFNSEELLLLRPQLDKFFCL